MKKVILLAIIGATFIGCEQHSTEDKIKSIYNDLSKQQKYTKG